MLVLPVVMLLPAILTSRVLVTILGVPMLLAVLVLPVRPTSRQEARVRRTAVEQPVADEESDGGDRAADCPLLLIGSQRHLKTPSA
jgi:hypothetical protein